MQSTSMNILSGSRKIGGAVDNLTALLFVCGVLVLTACTSKVQFQDGPINAHGGIGRTNSYESITSFPASESQNEKIPGPDSLSGALVPPLVLSSYQTVTANENNSITLSNSSMVMWSVKLDHEAFVCAGMCADASRNIYCAASDGILYSFSFEGKRRFAIRYSDTNNLICTDVLCMQDGVVLADSKGLFTKISLDGRVLWRWQASLPTLQTFAADENGAIYAAITHNDTHESDTLIKLTSNGTCEWKLALPSKRVITSPTVSNGVISIGVVHGGTSPELLSCSSTGIIRHTIPLRATPRGLSVASNGTVFCTGYNAGLGEPQSVIQAFGLDGREEWYLHFGCRLVSSPMLSATNIAVIGMRGDALAVYLVDKKGVLERFVSLDTAPSILLKAAVAPDGTLVFAGNSGAYLTRVGSKKGWMPL